MAKGIYVGVDGVVKKCKHYIGVGGVAKKVKKGYVGVSGTPKLMYSSDLAYSTTISQSFTPSAPQVGTANPKYAIFYKEDFFSKFYGYNSSYVESSVSSTYYTSQPIGNVSSGRIGNYALIIGGRYNTNYVNYIQSVNTSMVFTQGTLNSSCGIRPLVASSDSHCVVGGGFIGDSTVISNAIGITNALVQTDFPSLDYPSYGGMGASIGTISFLAGGSGNNYISNSNARVYSYDSSGVKTRPTDMSNARYGGKSSSNDKYVLFGGGYFGSTLYNTVDAYNINGTKVVAPALTYITGSGEGTAFPTNLDMGDYAVMLGNSSALYNDIVEIYDTSLVKTTLSKTYPTSTWGGACVLGDKLFALAGYDQTVRTYRNTIDIFSI